MSGFPARVRKLILDRAEGRCEGCGAVKALELHHRQYRSRGGPDTASNGLALCGRGNHTGCHGVAHTKAGEDKGWSVRSGFTPSERPAELVYGVVLLDDEGDFERFIGGELQEWNALRRFGATT